MSVFYQKILDQNSRSMLYFNADSLYYNNIDQIVTNCSGKKYKIAGDTYIKQLKTDNFDINLLKGKDTTLSVQTIEKIEKPTKLITPNFVLGGKSNHNFIFTNNNNQIICEGDGNRRIHINCVLGKTYSNIFIKNEKNQYQDLAAIGETKRKDIPVIEPDIFSDKQIPNEFKNRIFWNVPNQSQQNYKFTQYFDGYFYSKLYESNQNSEINVPIYDKNKKSVKISMKGFRPIGDDIAEDSLGDFTGDVPEGRFVLRYVISRMDNEYLYFGPENNRTSHLLDNENTYKWFLFWITGKGGTAMKKIVGSGSQAGGGSASGLFACYLKPKEECYIYEGHKKIIITKDFLFPSNPKLTDFVELYYGEDADATSPGQGGKYKLYQDGYEKIHLSFEPDKKPYTVNKGLLLLYAHSGGQGQQDFILPNVKDKFVPEKGMIRKAYEEIKIPTSTQYALGGPTFFGVWQPGERYGINGAGAGGSVFQGSVEPGNGAIQFFY